MMIEDKIQIPQSLINKIAEMPLDDMVRAINGIRRQIHAISPFASEPVDLIEWVKADGVRANDYNPNAVAPTEMELLKTSIDHDGYTQPVVTWNGESAREVVDGFHRTRVCKECESVRKRVSGYLPVVTIRGDCEDRSDRIAATIRHNRARGKHRVEAMSDIVTELKKRNWSDKRIAKELGMDEDEILRLCQITGLADLFDNQDFSASWEVGEVVEDVDAAYIEDVFSLESDTGSRIYHTWDKWECHKAGFYRSTPPKGMTPQECEMKYAELLADVCAFEEALKGVTSQWKHSCEHYLTNEKMNRIAWLGQAALAYAKGIPACYRGGYNMLTDEQKENADAIALVYLNKWLVNNSRDPLTEKDAASKTEANIY
jgi:ParB-like chromosome segregation protein Spo0J